LLLQQTQQQQSNDLHKFSAPYWKFVLLLRFSIKNFLAD